MGAQVGEGGAGCPSWLLRLPPEDLEGMSTQTPHAECSRRVHTDPAHCVWPVHPHTDTPCFVRPPCLEARSPRASVVLFGDSWSLWLRMEPSFKASNLHLSFGFLCEQAQFSCLIVSLVSACLGVSVSLCPWVLGSQLCPLGMEGASMWGVGACPDCCLCSSGCISLTGRCISLTGSASLWGGVGGRGLCLQFAAQWESLMPGRA